MRVAAVIPARYGSRRLEGKPLVSIMGKPMVQHVYERAKGSRFVEQVIVATDDRRIYESAMRFGALAAMTDSNHRCGTDRVAEVAKDIEADLIVNVQADEPLIEPSSIDAAISPLIEKAGIPMSTLMAEICEEEEYLNPNVVKVVVDEDGYALYFSRAAIPYWVRAGPVRVDRPGGAPLVLKAVAFKHIGLYVYRRDFLLRFVSLKPTPLEEAENLEQLRALEHGYKIKVVKVDQKILGVDRPEDIERVIKILSEKVSG